MGEGEVVGEGVADGGASHAASRRRVGGRKVGEGRWRGKKAFRSGDLLLLLKSKSKSPVAQWHFLKRIRSGNSPFPHSRGKSLPRT
jgi:hypothetical protein